MLAEENVQYAEQIVKVIEEHIQKVIEVKVCYLAAMLLSRYFIQIELQLWVNQ